MLSNDSLMVKCMQTMGHTNCVCVNETILCNYKITNKTNVLVPSAINVDIGIVGAGLSGLIAARKLIDTNNEVLIVEQDCFLGGILKNSNKALKL